MTKHECLSMTVVSLFDSPQTIGANLVAGADKP